MKKSAAIIAAVMVLAGAVFAADVTGTWRAIVHLEGGERSRATFVLKQDGEKLTGTYSGALGEAPLHGTIKGDEIVFDFEVQGVAVHYAGKLDAQGNKIEGTCDYGGAASGTFTATREASKDKK